VKDCVVTDSCHYRLSRFVFKYQYHFN